MGVVKLEPSSFTGIWLCCHAVDHRKEKRSIEGT